MSSAGCSNIGTIFGGQYESSEETEEQKELYGDGATDWGRGCLSGGMFVRKERTLAMRVFHVDCESGAV